MPRTRPRSAPATRSTSSTFKPYTKQPRRGRGGQRGSATRHDPPAPHASRPHPCRSSRSWTSRSWAARWEASWARSSRAPATPCGVRRLASHLRLVVRRRTHAGGDPRPDAAAEDRLCARGAARGRGRDDLRAHAPDDGRACSRASRRSAMSCSPSPARGVISPARGSSPSRRAAAAAGSARGRDLGPADAGCRDRVRRMDEGTVVSAPPSILGFVTTSAQRTSWQRGCRCRQS